ncbi:helix-turn-helix domain-containing protein [Aeromicrobium sp. UC242_57]|uniref:helix-turn-helix domain-containing protein n=1 Tax=Aeromicrobium sp. UC242_57 TaxID=3374624 RepID=UPI00378D8676
METDITDEPQRGRPRDPSRDEVIIDAAIDVLVREGYDRLSMEGVATAAGVGKATVYRRWSSKAELVIDAMSSLKPGMGTIDTGTLEGDIDLMVAAACSPRTQQLQQVMVSICSALPREPRCSRRSGPASPNRASRASPRCSNARETVVRSVRPSTFPWPQASCRR